MALVVCSNTLHGYRMGDKSQLPDLMATYERINSEEVMGVAEIIDSLSAVSNKQEIPIRWLESSGGH